ncbi:extracellular solute-binding protein family 5 [Anaeromyxobacter dehalogenans 2CP-1]|uniref:Extracellular solute-binding protein family 5 n=1 Tax=Anaeromyxobacter dehalogenans (strain ATCC BAA-258 / DSM 21875 / 2CP-1) TaxID=455488 RepID=B8J5F4_ANAD2|nr:ABC transporter substrate-binding protein [Anaeromyxobacter dehalogenans]ACL66816.1 extracellular solute-binding protein family 5 [Anaeromyxobacter dehalogenans 2CP-1]
MIRRAAAPGLALVLALGAGLPGPAAAAIPPASGGELRVLLPATPRVGDPAQATAPQDLALVRALQATLVEVDASGGLAPGLLAELPAPEPGGTAYRLRLRPGLRFGDGTPLRAADVAASLARLLARSGPAREPSPHAWVLLPVLGADAVLEGRAVAPAGLEVLSELELRVVLAFPFPELPWALAALPSAVVSSRGAGAGPFVLDGHEAGAVRLAPNPHAVRGLPFADRLLLGAAEARGAARALERRQAELAIRPEAVSDGAVPAAPLTVTLLALQRSRLGAGTEAVRRAVEAVDRAELARRFVRGPSVPLETLVPPAILPGRPRPRPGRLATAPAPRQLTLLVPAGAPEALAAADRLQVKLHDAGIRVSVETAPPERFAARLAAGDCGAAIGSVPVLGLRPALAAGQVALATRGPAAARQAMAALAGLEGPAALARVAELERSLDLVPLFASGQRASPAPALQGAAPRADGGIDPGDLWLLGGGAP